MIDWSQCSAVERVPGKVSGEWLFKGDARVPCGRCSRTSKAARGSMSSSTGFRGVTREQASRRQHYAERSLAGSVTGPARLRSLGRVACLDDQEIIVCSRLARNDNALLSRVTTCGIWPRCVQCSAFRSLNWVERWMHAEPIAQRTTQAPLTGGQQAIGLRTQFER